MCIEVLYRSNLYLLNFANLKTKIPILILWDYIAEDINDFYYQKD